MWTHCLKNDFLLFNICVIYLLFYSHGITWLTFSGRFAHTLGGYRKTSLSGRRTMSSTLNRKSTQTTHPSVKGTQNGRSLLLFPELISSVLMPFSAHVLLITSLNIFFPCHPHLALFWCFFSAQSAYFLSDQSLWFQWSPRAAQQHHLLSVTWCRSSLFLVRAWIREHRS